MRSVKFAFCFGLNYRNNKSAGNKAPNAVLAVLTVDAASSDYNITRVPNVLSIGLAIEMAFVPNTFTPNGNGINDTGILNTLIRTQIVGMKYTTDGENMYIRELVRGFNGMEPIKAQRCPIASVIILLTIIISLTLKMALKLMGLCSYYQINLL